MARSLGKHWKLTEQQKKNISLRMMGNSPTSETRLKMSLAKKGSLGNARGKHWKLSEDTLSKRKSGEFANHWKGGLPKCLDCEKQLAGFYAKRCVQCDSKRRDYKSIGLKGLIKQQNMKEPTSIEKTLYDYLLLKGILFEKQKLINGRFIVDAYIPSLNLVIEADGKYWHDIPKVAHKDKAENAYLTKCGFNLLRLTESEINDNSFKERMVF